MVLTCAHNLYDRELKLKTNLKLLKFSPAVSGDSGRPSIQVKQFYFPEEYSELKDGQENKHDFGIVELEEELDKMYGYLGIDTRSANTEGEKEIEVCGYPKEKRM